MQDWVKPIVLEGQHVRLEPLEHRHAPGLLKAATPDLFEFTPQGPRVWSVEGFIEDIDKVNAIGDTVAFAIVLKATGEVIGRTTYMEIRPPHRGLEIGRTWISRAQQGTAVNPDMKLRMMAHAFDALGAIRVQYKTGHRNLHSQRAIAKLGAVREGELRSHMIEPDGRVRGTVVFSVIAQEWPAVRQRLETRLAGQP